MKSKLPKVLHHLCGRPMIDWVVEAALEAGLVPAEALDPKWDFMYFFECMDAQGNGRIYPDIEKETPYVVVELERFSAVSVTDTPTNTVE